MWIPIRPDGTGDIAVLRLADPPPEGSTLARLVEDGARPELPVRTVGFPADADAGAHSTGVLRGRQATGWFQYDTDPASQYSVVRGFSGAPVWDRELGGVVGMVVAARAERDRRTAYVVPTETLCLAWPALRRAAKARSPFRDLRPFQENDAAVFHGRDDVARRIADRMAVGSGVTVVGASGSGKSSLLNAGIIPRLRPRDDLAIAVLRPGRAPLEALVLALLPLLEPDASATVRMAAEPQLMTMLREGRIGGLVDRVLAVQRKQGLLLVVDQFEESLVDPLEPELQSFAAALNHCTAPGSRMQVLMALRADFLGAALRRPAVLPLVDDSRLFPLGPMSADELRAAVERPLAGLAVRYEHGLVDRLLADLGPDPTRLPLLQFTLTRLWDKQQDKNGVISHAHYDALGGVGATLAKQAERAWTALPAQQRVHARSVLVQLVHPGGPASSPTRRVVTRTDLTPAQWHVAERLMTSRLLAPTEVHRAGGAPVEAVELAHETLLVQWQRLRDFVTQDAAFRTWQEGVRQRIAQWEREGRSGGRRMTGSDLREARGWRTARPDELSAVEHEFIRFSEAQTRRRRLVVTAVTAAMALVAATGTYLWRFQAEDRNRHAASATAAAVLAQQSRDAAQSTDQGGQYNALLLALRAYRTQHTAATRDLLAASYARYQFADLLVPYYITPTDISTLAPVAEPAVSADGTTVVSRVATGEQVVWRTGEQGGPLHTRRHEDLVAVSPDGSLIAMTDPPRLPTVSQPGLGGPPVVLVDARTGRVVRTLQSPTTGDMPPDLADDVLGLPSLGPLPDTPIPTSYAALAYDPTGRHIAAVTGVLGMGGRVILWNAASGKIERILHGPPEMLDSFQFTSGGRGLVAITQDLGNAGEGRTSGSLSSQVTTYIDTWDLRQTSPDVRRLRELSWQQGQQLVDVSPDGGVLAAADSRPTAKTLDTSVDVYRLPGGAAAGPRRWLRHNALVTGITVTAGGAHVFAYNGDNNVLAQYRQSVPGVLELPGTWQRFDTYSLSRAVTGLLANQGMDAVVEADDDTALFRRLAAVPDTTSSSPAGTPQQWFAALCRKIGDTTLPTAVEQKMPPGAYRGPLCP